MITIHARTRSFPPDEAVAWVAILHPAGPIPGLTCSLLPNAPESDPDAFRPARLRVPRLQSAYQILPPPDSDDSEERPSWPLLHGAAAGAQLPFTNAAAAQPQRRWHSSQQLPVVVAAGGAAVGIGSAGAPPPRPVSSKTGFKQSGRVAKGRVIAPGRGRDKALASEKK